MEIIEPARITDLPERTYAGIRVITPFDRMEDTCNELLAELQAWVERTGTETSGNGFLRLFVIDMSGPMDTEFGLPTPAPIDGDGRVEPGVLLAGRYATLTYRGDGIEGNRELIEWASNEGLEFDRHDVPEGDNFACRYEAFVGEETFEVAIKLA